MKWLVAFVAAVIVLVLIGLVAVDKIWANQFHAKQSTIQFVTHHSPIVTVQSFGRCASSIACTIVNGQGNHISYIAFVGQNQLYGVVPTNQIYSKSKIINKVIQNIPSFHIMRINAGIYTAVSPMKFDWEVFGFQQLSNAKEYTILQYDLLSGKLLAQLKLKNS